MLEKVAGVALVSKLRAILLIEADFNYHNKLIFGKRMMDLARQHGMVPEDLQEGLNQPQAVEVIDDDEALVMGPGFGGGGFINSVD